MFSFGSTFKHHESWPVGMKLVGQYHPITEKVQNYIAIIIPQLCTYMLVNFEEILWYINYLSRTIFYKHKVTVPFEKFNRTDKSLAAQNIRKATENKR